MTLLDQMAKASYGEFLKPSYAHRFILNSSGRPLVWEHLREEAKEQWRGAIRAAMAAIPPYELSMNLLKALEQVETIPQSDEPFTAQGPRTE